jgi:branched-chain amino acid transport system permease protein
MNKMRFPQISLTTLAIFIAYLLFVFIVPQTLSGGYTMIVINLALIYSISAYGVSIMLGMGGQLIFSSIAFMGAGAFFVANMCAPRQGVNMPSWAALLLLIPLMILVTFLLGLILLRLHGTYFTFSTIALTQVCYAIYNNYKPLFGGADGIAGIPPLTLFGYAFSSYKTWFYLLSAIVLLVALMVERIRRTQLGRALASVRDNTTAALTLGINVYITKVIAFTIAGTLAALAGALYCFHGKYVAADMFTYNNSVQYVIMAMLGGVNSTVGIFVGSLLVSTLPEFLKGFDRYFQLFWGVAIVLLMVFMPTGLAGLGGKIAEKLLPKKKARIEGKKPK